MSCLCYKLNEESKKTLIGLFPPKYPAVRYDHITVTMGGVNDPCPKPAESVEVIGIADDGNGIEVFIAKVNGSIRRPDGKIWHITASFDPQKSAPAIFDPHSQSNTHPKKPYKSVISNGFLRQIFDENDRVRSDLDPSWSVHLFHEPISIQTHPANQLNESELKKLNSKNLTL